MRYWGMHKMANANDAEGCDDKGEGHGHSHGHNHHEKIVSPFQ